MDVFLTGASGYVGGVIAEHLQSAGHRVLALSRSDRAAGRITALGATPVHGDLRAVDVLHDAATHADAIIHAAVDYTNPAIADIEAAALRAMLAAASGKPFVYTSSGLVYPTSSGSTPNALTEDHPVGEATAAQPHKVTGERTVLAAAGVDAVVLRAALVHGRGGSGLLQGLLTMARTRGVVPYIGDGSQTWSAVHVDDLAELFVLAIDKPQAHEIFNATSADLFSIRDLAETIAMLTDARPISLSLHEVASKAPQLAVLARSMPMDGSRARAAFSWSPERPSLLADLRSPQDANA